MSLTDTHCHIHEESYADSELAYRRALESGVKRLICVGTDETTSAQAVAFAYSHDSVWASVGLHPHDAAHGAEAIDDLGALLAADKGKKQIVAIGECGLDYFYTHSPRDKQIEMLHAHIELAQQHNLPLIFHVREAFDDFWPIFDSYSGLRGVLHSFTDNSNNLARAIERGLYIGVNGISTFTRSDEQKDMFRSIPLERLVLETDAPFLTPIPHRGKVNEPAFVKLVAEFMADLRSISPLELSAATEQNATQLFF